MRIQIFAVFALLIYPRKSFAREFEDLLNFIKFYIRHSSLTRESVSIV